MKTTEKTNKSEAFVAFNNAIEAIGSCRSFVFSACEVLKKEGKTQTECSNYFKEQVFKVKFPKYNFTVPEKNPVEQKRAYDTIRKNISDFWNPEKVEARKVAARKSSKAATTSKTTIVRKAATAPALTKKQIEELVLSTAKQDKQWAESLTEKLMALL